MAARSGEWAQHFSNASCIMVIFHLFKQHYSRHVLQVLTMSVENRISYFTKDNLRIQILYPCFRW